MMLRPAAPSRNDTLRRRYGGSQDDQRARSQRHRREMTRGHAMPAHTRQTPERSGASKHPLRRWRRMRRPKRESLSNLRGKAAAYRSPYTPEQREQLKQEATAARERMLSRLEARRKAVALGKAMRTTQGGTRARPPLSRRDRSWHIVGLVEDEDLSDLSENVDQYLAERYFAEIQRAP